MKKNYLLIVAILFVSIVNAQVTNTCLFDFSYNPGQLQSPAGWNNVMSNGDQDFTDNNGVVIGHLVSTGWTSANTSGTLAPTAPAINDFPTLTQTQDNIYGQSGGTGTITLSGLNSSKYYSFTVFGSRAGVTDNRETTYTFTGLNTGSASINPSSNNGSVAIINNIQPNESGIIVFTTIAGTNNVNASKYFYLAAMKMIVSNTTTALNKINQSNIKAYYSKGNLYFSENAGSVKIYNLTGKLLINQTAVSNVLPLQLAKGLYFLSTPKSNIKLIVE
ncbi:MAG TPA: hypothetical protein P5084_01345 [Paludibacter sp.]|nr:hypothetical protein [Paludibacter sp.]